MINLKKIERKKKNFNKIKIKYKNKNHITEFIVNTYAWRKNNKKKNEVNNRVKLCMYEHCVL